MVVAFHYLSKGPSLGWTGGVTFEPLQPVAQYAYFGLHLFFMISGFVIFMSVQNRSAGEFLKARFWRLYPTFWVAILITTGFVWVFGAQLFKVSAVDLLLNFSMTPELFGAKDVDSAYWSLMIELIFYFYVALACATQTLKRPLLLVAIALLISALNIVFKKTLVDLVFIAKAAPYFCIGILCYLIRFKKAVSKVAHLLLAVSIAVAATRDFIGAPKSANPWIAAMTITLISLAFYLIVAQVRQWPNNRLSRFVGNLSYPLYLIHQNIGYILIAALGSVLGGPIALLQTFLLVVTLSYLMHWLVETKWVPRIKKRLS